MNQIHKEPLGRPPVGGRVEAAAGTTPSTEGQQAAGADLGVIVANDRDRRTLVWLCDRVGEGSSQNSEIIVRQGGSTY
jgi:hypothetical protein